MEQEQKYRLKNILTVILECLLFVFLGLGILFIAKDSDDPIGGYIAGFLSIAFFGGSLIYYLIKLFTDKNFWEKQKKRQEKIKNNPYLYQLTHPYEQDINALKVFKKNFFLALPYIISIIFIITFLVFEFKTFYILGVIKNLNLGLWIILIYPYLLSFICFSFFILGYLALGEILQRCFHRAKNNFILDMIINYIYAIPFIAILSLVWIIFLFIKDDKNKSIPSSFMNALRRFSLYGLLILLKYYTFINLAIIAFEDRHRGIPFKESFQYLKSERGNLFFIWFKSGAIIGIPFLIGVGLVAWNEKFNFIDSRIPFAIFGISFVLFFLWGLLSEQLSFLLYFIQSRHKECKIESLK
jgi:hypothetical protein